MNIRHQQLGAPDKLAVLLSFNGTHGDFAAFVHIEAVGLSRIHLGMGRAVTHERTFADLCVDASRDKESDIDVVVFQFQRLVKAEQGMLGSAVG